MVLTSTQDRSTVCAEHTIGSEMTMVHLMVLLGDVGEVEACVSLFGDSVNLEARWVHGLRRTCNRLRNQLG